jgi:hypothetical protein
MKILSFRIVIERYIKQNHNDGVDNMLIYEHLTRWQKMFVGNNMYVVHLLPVDKFIEYLDALGSQWMIDAGLHINLPYNIDDTDTEYIHLDL